MFLKLERIAPKEGYTIGKLYIDGQYFCDTLEDKVRDLTAEPKVPAKTAIPPGIYQITLSVKSPKFGAGASYTWCRGYLPRLLNVQHFDGILIHAGNTADDTAGCILVGKNKAVGRVLESMQTLRNLYEKMMKAARNGEKLTIKIA